MGEEQLVVVRIGERKCGLDVQQIKEIVKLKSITPIPHAPTYVEGLMNLRGQIVSVIHLGQKLATLQKGSNFVTQNQDENDERIVVMNQSGELVGLHVDAVEEVLTFETESLELPDAGELKDKGIIDGVVQVNETIIMKLNTNLLLKPISGEGVEL